MLTKMTPVYWVPEAKSELWRKFLDEIFPGRPEIVRFILHGTGRNAKGTFLRALSATLGEYTVLPLRSRRVAIPKAAPGTRRSTYRKQGRPADATTARRQGPAASSGRRSHHQPAGQRRSNSFTNRTASTDDDVAFIPARADWCSARLYPPRGREEEVVDGLERLSDPILMNSCISIGPDLMIDANNPK